MMRIGIGEDIHRLVEGRPLRLAGMTVSFEKGLLGHSDGDMVLHAVSDALLGALALGDIGHLFPPEDPSIKGIDSAKILARCMDEVHKRGYALANVDVNIVAERPKLKPLIPSLRQSLAELLGVDVDAVSIKAKTNEGLGPVGEGQAMRCNAVVLLEKGETHGQ